MAKGADMEVVSATADMLAKRIGAGELIRSQDAHRFFDCLMCYCCGGKICVVQRDMLLKGTFCQNVCLLGDLE